MELHATPDPQAAEVSARLAGEIRAEMARQKRTASELAAVLNISAHTVGRRLNGSTPFNIEEAMTAAIWLGVGLTDLVTRAARNSQAVAS